MERERRPCTIKAKEWKELAQAQVEDGYHSPGDMEWLPDSLQDYWYGVRFNFKYMATKGDLYLIFKEELPEYPPDAYLREEDGHLCHLNCEVLAKKPHRKPKLAVCPECGRPRPSYYDN